MATAAAATAATTAAKDEQTAHRFAKDQLKAFVERVERLEEEKKAIADDIRDVYAEAKGNRLRCESAAHGGPAAQAGRQSAQGAGGDTGNLPACAGDVGVGAFYSARPAQAGTQFLQMEIVPLDSRLRGNERMIAASSSLREALATKQSRSAHAAGLLRWRSQ